MEEQLVSVLGESSLRLTVELETPSPCEQFSDSLSALCTWMFVGLDWPCLINLPGDTCWSWEPWWMLFTVDSMAAIYWTYTCIFRDTHCEVYVRYIVIKCCNVICSHREHEVKHSVYIQLIFSSFILQPGHLR